MKKGGAFGTTKKERKKKNIREQQIIQKQKEKSYTTLSEKINIKSIKEDTIQE